MVAQRGTLDLHIVASTGADCSIGFFYTFNSFINSNGHFRSVTLCMRVLWRSRRFFSEEHAAHATSAVLRALAHYTASGPPIAVDTCLHFLCDLLSG